MRFSVPSVGDGRSDHVSSHPEGYRDGLPRVPSAVHERPQIEQAFTTQFLNTQAFQRVQQAFAAFGEADTVRNDD
jgi:hypothetical protein